MANELTADDLLPLIAKLSVQERRRLLHMALNRGFSDGDIYIAHPPEDDEFTCDEDALGWDADGWEGVE